MIYLVLAVAAIGHVILWATLVNRLHGMAIERRWMDRATMLSALAMGGLPLVVAGYFWQQGRVEFPADSGVGTIAAWGYIYLSAAWCVFSVLHRVWLTLHSERRGALESNHTARVDLTHCDRRQLIAPGIPRLLGLIPGNQVVDLHVHEKRIAIPRMPAGRELRVVHITDLHMSGRITKQYFIEMVAAVNALEPDLVMLTGDLVEREACMNWLPETLGQLRGAAGVYFVLGNHDLRVDHRRLIERLSELGLIHVGGTWREAVVRDTPIVIAGNELPWFGPAPRTSGMPPRDASGLPLRVLLAHAPDQFAWAQRHDFDLMLAGHNHGGQVRLPLVGPILAPSLSGVRYASGTFRRDKTVLHVSRGTGGLTPFRWNCPPEITLLIIVPGQDGPAILPGRPGRLKISRSSRQVEAGIY
jgi:predicted MPP superfamily phosphohydrolase